MISQDKMGVKLRVSSLLAASSCGPDQGESCCWVEGKPREEEKPKGSKRSPPAPRAPKGRDMRDMAACCLLRGRERGGEEERECDVSDVRAGDELMRAGRTGEVGAKSE